MVGRHRFKRPFMVPMRPGQTVVCSDCGRMTSAPIGDREGPSFTFHCIACSGDLSNLETTEDAENKQRP